MHDTPVTPQDTASLTTLMKQLGAKSVYIPVLMLELTMQLGCSPTKARRVVQRSMENGLLTLNSRRCLDLTEQRAPWPQAA